MLILLIFVSFLASGRGNEDEQRLYADLLNNYNALERPVENSSDPLVVKVRLFLQQIVDVDEKNQMVQVNAWIRYVCKDTVDSLYFRFLGRAHQHRLKFFLTW